MEIDAGGRALVLGGGGVTGVAWEIGLLHGLATAGVDLPAADLLVGTSAGSVVGAQLACGLPLADMYAGQVAGPGGEVPARIGVGTLLAYAAAGLWPGDRRRGRALLGRAALRAATVPEAERHAVIERRVPARDWPARRLLVPAVVAATGETVVFDRDSGVPLVDAVAASCAVPLVWPPMTVGGVRYVDGGVRSIANVDLARGHARVVVLAPSTAAVRRGDRPAAQARRLGPGVRTLVVGPDAAARAAIGTAVLDPARRAPAARAGFAQAAGLADRLRAFWA